jgi:hypothetical protein
VTNSYYNQLVALRSRHGKRYSLRYSHFGNQEKPNESLRTISDTFACPIYLPVNSLQSGQRIDKWSDISNIGIYLGRSPQNAQTVHLVFVHLVLPLSTRLASPQFHLKVDNKFETLRTAYGNNSPIPSKSLWQEKSHFTEREHMLRSTESSVLPSTSPAAESASRQTATTLTASRHESTTQLPVTDPPEEPMPPSEGAQVYMVFGLLRISMQRFEKMRMTYA